MPQDRKKVGAKGMKHILGPSVWGMVFTRSDTWKLSLDARTVRVVHQAGELCIPLPHLRVQVARGFFWSTVTFTDEDAGATTRFDGIPVLNGIVERLTQQEYESNW